LPAPPADLRGWSMSGGSLSIAMESVSDEGLLSTRMSSFDVHEGMRLVLPINNAEGGGYDVICEVVGRFYRNGLEVTATLSVIRVERRKPFRSEPRAALNELCLIRLTSRQAGIVEFDGKIMDVSASGVGIGTDRAIEPGDRLEVASRIGPDALRCTVIALHSERIAFGRYRTGCRIEAANGAGTRVIEQYVRAKGDLAGTASLRRRHVPRVA
jgi:hypothetical protein